MGDPARQRERLGDNIKMELWEDEADRAGSIDGFWCLLTLNQLISYFIPHDEET
jgi:hypothetical protein